MDILTAIRNATGPRPALFVPEVRLFVFHMPGETTIIFCGYLEFCWLSCWFLLTMWVTIHLCLISPTTIKAFRNRLTKTRITPMMPIVPLSTFLPISRRVMGGIIMV